MGNADHTPTPLFGSPTTAVHTDTMVVPVDRAKTVDLSMSLQRLSSTLSLREKYKEPHLSQSTPNLQKSKLSQSTTNNRSNKTDSCPSSSSSSPDIIAQKGIPVSSIASISAISETPDLMGSVHSTLQPSYFRKGDGETQDTIVETATEPMKTQTHSEATQTSSTQTPSTQTPTSSSWWRKKVSSQPSTKTPPQSQQTLTATCISPNSNRASDCIDSGAAATTPPTPVETVETVVTSSWWFFSFKSEVKTETQASNSEMIQTGAHMSVSCNPTGSDDPTSRAEPSNEPQAQKEPQNEPQKGWFSWWNSSTQTIEASPVGSEEKDESQEDMPQMEEEGGEVVVGENKGEGRSWGFWSTGTGSKKTSGEVAVIGIDSSSSTAHPSSDPPGTPRPSPVSSPKLEATEPSEPVKSIKDPKDKKLDGATQSGDASPSTRKVTKSGKPYRQNLVIPSPDACFPEYSQRDYFFSHLKKLSSYWVPKHTSGDPALNQYNQFYSSVYRTPKPTEIKKAVVIGVHGFFPAKVVRTFIGEPTGTSVRFANMGAEAVERWAQSHDMDVEIERIALEGEGKVLQRVDNLYKILMNWIDHVKDADLIYFCAHSQGVPVATHILARLIENGLVDNKKIGILAMAGISLGPFYGLDSKFVMRMYSTSVGTESLHELFEFQDTNSLMARKYLQSLRTVLAHNCKIAFVGSMNDQMVPLYSSTCMHVTHPCIFRAVYVDGKDVAPEFISDLVSLALLLRNIGSTDHNVIKEVSGAVAGALTGGGHSKIYNEGSVYDLGFQYITETTLPSNPVAMGVFENFSIPKKNSNPYNLPYCMRSMQYETLARPQLRPLLENLNQEFEKWKPESKPLRDLKYRLSPIQNQAKL